MKIKNNPNAIRLDIDPRDLQRTATQMEPTLWHGTALARTVHENHPGQPNWPMENPAMTKAKQDQGEMPITTNQPMNADFWRRILYQANLVAAERYISQLKYDEQVTRERVSSLIELTDETNRIYQTNHRRSELNYRIAILRAAANFTKLDIHKQRAQLQELEREIVRANHVTKAQDRAALAKGIKLHYKQVEADNAVIVFKSQQDREAIHEVIHHHQKAIEAYNVDSKKYREKLTGRLKDDMEKAYDQRKSLKED